MTAGKIALILQILSGVRHSPVFKTKRKTDYFDDNEQMAPTFYTPYYGINLLLSQNLTGT